jgi:hypothetical protein
MDYVTRQFINLTKNFRKDLRKALAELRQALQQQTRAIDNHYKREEQRQAAHPSIQVFAELHTPEDVERHRTSNEERQYRLQFWNAVGTWGAFLAVAIYAGITFLQWWDFNKSIGLSQIIARQARVQAIAAVESAKAAKIAAEVAQFSVEAERPWIGPNGIEASPVGNDGLAVAAHIINSGRSPAYIFNAQWNHGLYKILPDSPEYLKKQGTHPLSGTYILVPNHDVRWKADQFTLTQQEMRDMQAGKVGLYFYMKVDYRDLRTKEVHHTHMCWAFEGIKVIGACNEYNYAD